MNDQTTVTIDKKTFAILDRLAKRDSRKGLFWVLMLWTITSK